MGEFQSAVLFTQGIGVQGDIMYDGPRRCAPWQLVSSPQPNIIGATAYTITSGQADATASGIAQAGGTGAFAGILINSKVYANYNSALTPTLTLPDDIIAELMTMGFPLVKLTAAANPGDPVVYDVTTGALSAVAAQFAATASFATNVMTVTAASGVIGPGSLVDGFAGVPPGTTVLSIATGTGGAGTYNLSTTPGTVGSANGIVKAGLFAGTGKKFVPDTRVSLRSTTANGLAIIEMTA